MGDKNENRRTGNGSAETGYRTAIGEDIIFL